MSLRNTIFEHVYGPLGFPSGTSGKEPTCQCRRHKRQGFDSWVRNITWKRKWQPTPAFLPGEFQGQRSPPGYSPWGPLSMGFSRQECWSGLPFPFPGDPPDPLIQPASLKSPALAGRFFTTSATRVVHYKKYILLRGKKQQNYAKGLTLCLEWREDKNMGIVNRNQ